MVKKTFFVALCTKIFAFYSISRIQFSPKKHKSIYSFEKKSKFFPNFLSVHSSDGFVKKERRKKRAAFCGELLVSGDGGGSKGMVSKGKGYKFDVFARLENSTITPSLIFFKFSPKISKSDDCNWVFYCLK